MKFIFSLLLIVSLSFSQSLKITSPTNGQSFRLNDIIEIKWEAESRVNITGEIVLYWSETDRIIDFKVIDRVSVAEKSYSWFLEKSDFINSDGEIFIIARWKGVDSIVGIEIGPIIRKSRIGDISFTSKISGVQVSLNEKFEGTTPFTKKEVGFGRIRIKAEKDGYRDTTFTVNHNIKNNIVSISLSRPIIKKSRIGDISFTSRISGVQVSLNGKYEGTTPFTKKGLKFGSIRIKAEKSGFDVNTFIFDHQQKNSPVDINLLKHTGTLRLIMNELIEAKISVNNVSHDNAHLRQFSKSLYLKSGWDYIYPMATKPTSHRKSLRLPVGVYTIVANAKKEKRSTFLKEVTIRRNRHETIEIKLLELQGRLKLNFNLPWNMLALSHEVDGDYKKLTQSNVTPYLLLKNGRHNFIVKSPKYESQKFSVNINREELYTINKELKLKSKGGALRRNILFPGVILPGTGQLYSEDTGRGLLYMAVHVALAYGIYDSYSKYTGYSDKANMYKDKYNTAVTGSAMSENWAAYNVNAVKANDASKLMITFSSGLAVNWLVTLFDSLFLSGLD